jgi:hypothetical protein
MPGTLKRVRLMKGSAAKRTAASSKVEQRWLMVTETKIATQSRPFLVVFIFADYNNNFSPLNLLLLAS